MAFDPDSQFEDWYGWLTTQAGHSVLVGVPGALALAPWWGLYAAPVLVALIYLLVWEIAVQRVGAGWIDAVEDTACVMSGASLICGAQLSHSTAAVCFALWSAFLTLGVFRRVFRRQA